MVKEYSLIDSGDLYRLERFGDYVLSRPCPQALWKPSLNRQVWDKADASFSREGSSGWKMRTKLPDQWIVEIAKVKFKISLTDFGHVGLFPEHSLIWNEMRVLIQTRKKPPQILNLFAYSGGATLAAAQAGAQVCHLDASKGMVSWARENATLNDLAKAPIRWIIDDVMKFLLREAKRGTRYDGIILDPPTFGRGNKGEVFKIEREIQPLLHLCRSVLSDNPLFIYFTSHTPGMTPMVLQHLLEQMMHGFQGELTAREMILPAERGLGIPYGSVALWRA